MLQTARLNLQPWREHHRDGVAAVHADPIVMADLGGPISRAASHAKFDRYSAAFAQHGVSRRAVEDRDGCFLVYAGVMPRLGSRSRHRERPGRPRSCLPG
jgi:hypothetical protein